MYLFKKKKDKFSIPYNFIDEIQDLLTEYEDQNLNIEFCIKSYFNNNLIYGCEYRNNYCYNVMPTDLDKQIKLYKRNNIPLNQFVYWININNDKELAIKFVGRLKHFYPNINENVLSHNVFWSVSIPSYKLNNQDRGVYFILD